MKARQMVTPALEQIYNQRNHYQHHKRKLETIYKNRKSQLGYDSTRIIHFQSLKQGKIKSFVHKFNQNSNNIAKSNLLLLNKLERVKSSFRSTSCEEGGAHSTSAMSPFARKKLEETEKENMRISNRMRKMCSELNQRKFIKDYAKSQQIKNRIMRYTTEESRVYLKSRKYFGENQQNTSALSRKSKLRTSYKTQNQYQTEPQHRNHNNENRRSLASHYRREDIIKNKIDDKMSSFAQIRRAKNQRPNTSIEGENKYGDGDEETPFFPTQPKKNRLLRVKF